MTFSCRQISVRAEGERGFTPSQVEIGNGFLTIQKINAVAGVAGGLVGLLAYEQGKRNNETVRIPLDQICSVETDLGFVSRHVTVRAPGYPAYTIGCSTKKEMEQIAALLREGRGYAPQPPMAAPFAAEIPARPVAAAPAPKFRCVALRMMAGARAGVTYRLQEGQTMIIGRNPSRCDLPLAEYSTISGRHCCLELKGTLTVTDLGSTNGTWLNGVRLLPDQPAAVPEGSELRLAGQDCVLRVAFE